MEISDEVENALSDTNIDALGGAKFLFYLLIDEGFPYLFMSLEDILCTSL